MQISIERGKKQGRKYVIIKEVDCNHYRSLCDLSNKICGTTNTHNDGIFTENKYMDIYYGGENIIIDIFQIDLISTPYPMLIKELKRRIKIVREWVSAIDYNESTTFDI